MLLFHELRGDRRSEVPARLQLGPARLAGHHYGLGHLEPAESGGDRREGALGSLGSLIAVEVRAKRPASAAVEQRVVTLVEGVFEATTQVAEVHRGAEQVAVGLQHLDRRDRQSRTPHHLDPDQAGIGRPCHHGFQHLLAVWRGRVVNDEQA